MYYNTELIHYEYQSFTSRNKRPRDNGVIIVQTDNPAFYDDVNKIVRWGPDFHILLLEVFKQFEDFPEKRIKRDE